MSEQLLFYICQLLLCPLQYQHNFLHNLMYFKRKKNWENIKFSAERYTGNLKPNSIIRSFLLISTVLYIRLYNCRIKVVFRNERISRKGAQQAKSSKEAEIFPFWLRPRVMCVKNTLYEKVTKYLFKCTEAFNFGVLSGYR